MRRISRINKENEPRLKRFASMVFIGVFIVQPILMILCCLGNNAMAAGAGQKIADKARELAWSESDKAKSTSPTDSFVAAAESAGTDGSNDCLTFVKTAIIASGADADYPKGSNVYEANLVDYMSSSNKWEQINTTNESDLQIGDILVSADTSGQGRNHIFVYLGGGKTAGANLGQWYGRIGNLADEWELGSGGQPFYYSGNQYKVFRNGQSGDNDVSLSSYSKSTMPATMLEEFAQNNILFYDPYECISGSDGTRFCTMPSGKDITWIGDSYSTGAQSLIEKEFPGISFGNSINDANSTVQACKFVSANTTCNANPTNPSGLKVLQDVIDAGNLKPYLVFALGTNGGWTANDIKNFEDIMAKQPDTKVVLVTAKTPNEDFTSSNELLKKMTDNNENFFLADWTTVYQESFFSGDSERIHPVSNGGYDAWVKIIKDTLPQNCTAGLLPGNSIAEKIWNYFVQADIDGVSDNPAAIAGIIGNLYTESGLNPFMNGSTSDYYRGLFMLNSSNGSGLWNAINSAVGANYWAFYDWWCGVSDYPDGNNCADNVLSNNNVPQDAIDTAIKMELDYLVLGEVNGEKVSDQTFHNEFLDFVKHFDVITNKDKARSYSELFLITVEIAYETSDVKGEAPQDPGVRSFGISRGYERWQGAESRGNNAEEFYNRYSNVTVPTTTTYSGSMTSGNSNITAASSGGYNKYDDLTDAELWDLAELGILENGGTLTAFRNTLSITANLFEKNGNSSISGHNLLVYVRDGGWFNSSNAAKMNGYHDINVGSKYLDAARDVLMKGNRTVPTQILEFDCVGDLDWVELDGQRYTASNPGGCGGRGLNEESYYVAGKTKIHNVYGSEYIFYGWMSGEFGTGDPMGYFENNPPTDAVLSDSGNNGNCPADNDNGAGGAKIAEAAVKMAWPVQAGQDDDAHVGQCEESSGNWITFTTEERPCKTNARKLYHDQLIAQGRRSDGMDCGVYVGTVLQYVGAIDNITSTYDMQSDYFRPSDDWEEIDNKGVESMKPGDVLVANGSELGHSTGHILFFVGDYGGSYGNIADASLDSRVAQVGNIYNDTVWHVWRYKRGGEESDKPIEPLYDSSVDIPCDPRTEDIGVRDDAYRNGQRFSIRLCSVPNIVDTDSPGGDGVNDGHIHVNSRVSGAYYALAEAHAKRCGGQKLTASEGYRTYDHQAMLYNNLGARQAASPGYSNHQAGLAVDFNQSTYCNSDSSIASGGAFNLGFLEEFGLRDGRNFSVVEYWHVQPIGAD